MRKIVGIMLCVLVMMGVFIGCAGAGNQPAPTPSPTPTATPTPAPTPTPAATPVPGAGTAQGLKDGTYTAESDHTDKGWYAATVTIQDEKYTDIKFTKYDSKGNVVDLTQYKHEPAVEAMEKYPNQLIEVQDPTKIDRISGATGTYNALQEIMAKIRDQAK